MSNLLFYILYFSWVPFFFRCYTFWNDSFIFFYFHLFSLYFFLGDFLRFTLKSSHLMFHLCFHWKSFPMCYVFSLLMYGSSSFDTNSPLISCRTIMTVFETFMSLLWPYFLFAYSFWSLCFTLSAFPKLLIFKLGH